MEYATIINSRTFLNGLRVKVIRQSARTGRYTVELLEPAMTVSAYPKGTRICLNGYELSFTMRQPQSHGPNIQNLKM